MSKVVHLSDNAHQKAKEYCQVRGLKMSEWVAALIDRAAQEKAAQDDGTGSHSAPASGLPGHARGTITQNVALRAQSQKAEPTAAPYEAMVQKKKLAKAVGAVGAVPESTAHVYEAPPFWAR